MLRVCDISSGTHLCFSVSCFLDMITGCNASYSSCQSISTPHGVDLKYLRIHSCFTLSHLAIVNELSGLCGLVTRKNTVVWLSLNVFVCFFIFLDCKGLWLKTLISFEPACNTSILLCLDLRDFDSQMIKPNILIRGDRERH